MLLQQTSFVSQFIHKQLIYSISINNTNLAFRFSTSRAVFRYIITTYQNEDLDRLHCRYKFEHMLISIHLIVDLNLGPKLVHEQSSIDPNFDRHYTRVQI